MEAAQRRKIYDFRYEIEEMRKELSPVETTPQT
jgi:hypothetical protein